jgi:hypothetical protein
MYARIRPANDSPDELKAPVHTAEALCRAAKGGDRQAEEPPDAAKAPARQAEGAAEQAAEAGSGLARETARLDPPEGQGRQGRVSAQAPAPCVPA